MTMLASTSESGWGNRLTAPSVKTNFVKTFSTGCAISETTAEEKIMARRVAIVGFIVGVVVAGAIFAVKAMRQGPKAKQWQIESPNRKYKIAFRGTPTTPAWPFTGSPDVQNRKVTAEITKDGVPLVQGAGLYGGDAYDYSFDDLYPDHEWLSESILHLWDKRDSQKPEAISEEIALSNESGRQIKYLYLKAGKTNLFLLFDLAPGARITLPVHLQHWEEVIGCQAKVEAGDLPYHDEDFSLSTPGKSGTRYAVKIHETACSVMRE